MASSRSLRLALDSCPAWRWRQPLLATVRQPLPQRGQPPASSSHWHCGRPRRRQQLQGAPARSLLCPCLRKGEQRLRLHPRRRLRRSGRARVVPSLLQQPSGPRLQQPLPRLPPRRRPVLHRASYPAPGLRCPPAVPQRLLQRPAQAPCLPLPPSQQQQQGWLAQAQAAARGLLARLPRLLPSRGPRQQTWMWRQVSGACCLLQPAAACCSLLLIQYCQHVSARGRGGGSPSSPGP